MGWFDQEYENHRQKQNATGPEQHLLVFSVKESCSTTFPYKLLSVFKGAHRQQCSPDPHDRAFRGGLLGGQARAHRFQGLFGRDDLGLVTREQAVREVRKFLA